MQQDNPESSLKTLHEIRNIMERSTRFMSLSGWSGVWAGVTALVGAFIAHKWISIEGYRYNYTREALSETTTSYTDFYFMKLLFLAICVFMIALVGGYYFTWRKVKTEGASLWTPASRSMMRSIAIPMFCGAVFCLAFIWQGHAIFLHQLVSFFTVWHFTMVANIHLQTFVI